MKFDDKLFKKKWVSYTIATCSAVLLYVILGNLSNILDGVNGFFDFIKPIISGIIVAYIFNPFANFFEEKVFTKVKNEKFRWKLSVAVSLVAIVICLVLLFVALIPQLVESVKTLFGNMDTYLDTLHNLLSDFEDDDSKIFGLDLSSLANLGDNVLQKIGGYFTDNMGDIMNTTSTVGKGVVDALLAVILAIYFLLDKKRITTGCSRLIELIMKEENYTKSMEFLKRCNGIMIRYIAVDVVDGIAVGVINLLFMLVMRMPYAVLISVIVGVTNLAPTFGPLVGAVLGAFVLVLVNPWYALWFLIFTVVLQTVDGYILKPRLFGGSLGVSALMILIAIILGGRLFGVFGILIAIPISAIVDFVWKDFVIKKLEERRAKS